MSVNISKESLIRWLFNISDSFHWKLNHRQNIESNIVCLPIKIVWQSITMNVSIQNMLYFDFSFELINSFKQFIDIYKCIELKQNRSKSMWFSLNWPKWNKKPDFKQIKMSNLIYWLKTLQQALIIYSNCPFSWENWANKLCCDLCAMSLHFTHKSVHDMNLHWN